MTNIKQAFVDIISNKMKINGNVLHPRVCYWVQTKLGSPDIVTQYEWRFGEG